jgi:hypothetical protein
MPAHHSDNTGLSFNTPHSYSWEKLGDELVLIERNLLELDHVFFAAPVVIASISPDPNRVLVDAWGVVIWRNRAWHQGTGGCSLNGVRFPAELKLYFKTADKARAAVDWLFKTGDLKVLLEPGLWEHVIEYGESVPVRCDPNGRQLPAKEYYAHFDKSGARITVERGDCDGSTTKNLWRARRGGTVLIQDDQPAWFARPEDARQAVALYELLPNDGGVDEFCSYHIYSWR